MGLEISPVVTERDFETFLQVPRSLRPAFHENKIPGRWMRPLLDHRRNPYFRHADHQLLLARRDGRVVGRVAVFVDHLCNRTLGESMGTFGLFDCIDSPRVANLLFEAAERWLTDHGVMTVRGPQGPAMRLGTGVLVEGHGQPPMPGLTFDPPEIGALIEGAGYIPDRDLLAMRLPVTGVNREVVRAADRARRRPGINLRAFKPLKYGEELEHIATVMNELPALGRACAPWTLDEVRWMARKLFLVIDPFLVLLIERDGEPLAVGVALRNVREALGGRSPRATLRDSVRLAAAMHFGRLQSARIALLATSPAQGGSREENNDLLALLLHELLGRLQLRGVRWVEVSLVDPTDQGLIDVLNTAGGEVTKMYRIFEKSLESSRKSTFGR